MIAAFSSDADLYILDEPTSGLDPLMERVFQECILEAKNEGKSVLLSSHILSEVERLCDKVAIIREGKIIETGSLNELRHLTGTLLHVETKSRMTSLDEVKGVHDIEVNNQLYSFHVDAKELDDVMKYVSQYGIVKLESAPPTLEDLFMRHYEGDSQFEPRSRRCILMAKQVFTNTGILTRFILRRDRFRFPIWLLSLSALTVLVAKAFRTFIRLQKKGKRLQKRC